MRKKKELRIVVHVPEDTTALADRISEFHAEIIARRLRQADLTAAEKVNVIRRIMELLKEPS